MQSTGFLNAMETRYIADQLPLSEVPVILFLATVSVVQKYEFNKQSASLMRPLGSTIPDANSFITGLVTVLYQVQIFDKFTLNHSCSMFLRSRINFLDMRASMYVRI